jgi:TorA maturation chaperone TorD
MNGLERARIPELVEDWLATATGPVPALPRQSLDDLRLDAEVRSRTWWLLSRFYLERPEPVFLAELAAAFAAGAGADDAGAGEDFNALVETLHDAGSPAVAQRLCLEYTRLLRGLREGQGPPPPYESVYRGQTPGGDLTLAVRHRYRDAGFGDVGPRVGPQDHVAAELRFLALLALREAQAWDAGDIEPALRRVAQQQGFLDVHLLAWLPTLVARIEAEAREPFYRSAARLTLTFAREARAALDLIECDPAPG